MTHDPSSDSARRAHWDERYASIGPLSVSWHEARPRLSLAMLELAGSTPIDAVIDVGGGASALAGELVARAYTDITVLDLSDAALALSRQSLERADAVHWLRADITEWMPMRTWDVWHDRAVFHFLTEPAQRDAYRRSLDRGLAPGGRVALATFAEDGPEQCSGLPVVRYSPEALLSELGESLHEIARGHALHTTPSGGVQPFSWVVASR